ncbi:hypothetical protein [Rhizobium sp. SG741]|uniref:hypothetical protein n=1 Tax=Rhizobium sp. SG741 TaxID=2587114 RepID=UPI0014456CC6|nr:hypothetical protein [Rhizobium sp. SG741]NKJ03095.1 hypothetical protein [Rhizobium sp. SG741]
MLDRRFVDELETDYTPTNAAGSVEPMQRPDHKAKKRGRPNGKPSYMRRFPKNPRDGEAVGGGHFVFRRGDSTGRIRPCMWPFEHPDFDSASNEASRLAGEHGGTFDVFSRSLSVSVTKDAAE